MDLVIGEWKLRGIVQDGGGALLESIRGLVCVRLGDEETKVELKKGLFSWFDRRTGLIEMYLRVRAADQDRLNTVVLTVLLRSLDGLPPDDPDWRGPFGRLAQKFRGYLVVADINPGQQKTREIPES